MFAPPGIGPAEARAFLASHLGADVGAVEIVGEGAWSRCFGFTLADRALVIRFGAFVEDFEKDRRAGEFSSPALPVPEVTEIGEADGCFFAISARAHGSPLESASPSEWRTLLPSLFGALDAARSQDVSGTVGHGLWNGGGDAGHASWRDHLLAVDVDTLEGRTHGWRRRLVDSAVGDDAFRAGVARLSELVDACPEGRHLVHSDLVNGNVLVDSGRIEAVLDWGCSLYGDFLYDIAWLEFWAPWHPSLAAIDIRAEARRHYASVGLAVEDLDDRLRCYEIHIALDAQAYCAFTGDRGGLESVTGRLLTLLD